MTCFPYMPTSLRSLEQRGIHNPCLTTICGSRLAQLGQALGFTLILTHLYKPIQGQFQRQGLWEESANAVVSFTNLDLAMEWCEAWLLAADSLPLMDRGHSLRQFLAESMLSREEIERLLEYLEKDHFPGQHTLLHEGEASKNIYFLESGRVSIELQVPGGDAVRLRTIKGGTMIGELGVYLDRPRSATVTTLEPSTLYRLRKESLVMMERIDPELAAAVHRLVACVEGKRLISMNNMIRALTR